MGLKPDIVSHHHSETLRYPERLPPGSKILYVCDGTDDIPDGGIINGVKRTQQSMTAELRKFGYNVDVLHPQKLNASGQKIFPTAQLPGYEGFEFALNPLPVFHYINESKPDAIFIATLEGPLGMATAFACHNPLVLGQTETLPYTASFTTRLDKTIVDMVHQWTNAVGDHAPAMIQPFIQSIALNPAMFHPIQRALYNGASKILVTTNTMMQELNSIGLKVRERGVLWPRGINTELFHLPENNERNPYLQYDWYQRAPKPIAMYFGRIAPEKNIEAFLQQNIPFAHKVVIGDGPSKEELTQKYPEAHFLGKKYNEELAAYIRWAQVHIFPSLSDTFGNTILEAGASGVPTIGFTGAAGPQDIVTPGVSGYLISEAARLPQAVQAGLSLSRAACAHDIVSRYSWKTASEILLHNLETTAYTNENTHQLR